MASGVCGGGHSELCVVDGGITLHMKALASVTCDPDARTLTIGAGATFDPAMEASAPHGLVMPSGTAPTVGVGAVLGGGVGKLTRSYGLACDNVVAAEIVLADGSRRMVRDGVEADAELLWAIRGCGAAFGVVTSLVIKAYPVVAARHECRRASLSSLLSNWLTMTARSASSCTRLSPVAFKADGLIQSFGTHPFGADTARGNYESLLFRPTAAFYQNLAYRRAGTLGQWLLF